MARIAFFELEEWEKDYLKQRLKGHELIMEKGLLDEKSVKKAARAEVVCTFLYSHLTPENLEKIKGLRALCTMSTGFDHVPLDWCKKKGVRVCNVPSYGENTVAEHAFALILSVSRRIIPSVERAKKGDFSLKGLRGFDLKGKTLGVVGTGKIGRNVILFAKAFGMKVIAFDPRPDKKFAEEAGFTYASSLEKLLKESDVVSLHAPLNKQTMHLINESNISSFKKGAVLINTARGGLVQTSALLKALKKGIISYAALDVLEEECFVKEEKELLSDAFLKTCNLKTVLENHILLQQDNVIITPHNAFNSTEALQRILDTTVENIGAFLKRKPVNKVQFP